MDLGHLLLDLAQIFAPIIALLMVAIKDDVFSLSKRQAMFAQLALILILLLSLLIPVVLIAQNR